MKTIRKMVALLTLGSFLLFSVESCKTFIVTKKGKVPPGHMKKIMGDQSGAPYAPGHNKPKKKR